MWDQRGVAGKDFSEIPEKIHICYCVITATNQLAASMCSLFENTESWLSVHILYTKEFPKDEIPGLVRMARKYGQDIDFTSLEEKFPEDLGKALNDAGFGPFNVYRYFLHKIFSDDVKRIINLDSDTIVNLDIAEFWDHSLDGALFGACIDNPMQEWHYPRCMAMTSGKALKERYFNAGIYLMDLAAIRQEGEFGEKVSRYLIEHKEELTFLDQDVMNILYGRVYKVLPEKFNTLTVWAYTRGWPVERRIYHYAGAAVGIDNNNPYDCLYWKYLLRTEWGNEAKVLHGFQMLNARMRYQIGGLAGMFNAVLSRPQVIYWGFGEFEEWLKERNLLRPGLDVYIRSNEENTRAVSTDPLREELERREIGQYALIILSDAYMQLSELLEEMGLKENVDFFDGMIFVWGLKGKDNFRMRTLIEGM